MNSGKDTGPDRDYLEAVYDIYNHGGRGPETAEEKIERQRFMRRALEELCPGFENIRVVHIAGTSGKGSTALFLHSIVSQHTRTGLIISPHIFDFNERIQINGQPIPHSSLTRQWNKLRPELQRFEEESGERALFQEIVLLLAFRFFIEQGVEWAVVETGLGGRFDQTRALDASLTVITRIGLDHTHILGHTITEIAREKAGIIRRGVRVYTGETGGEALNVIRRTAEEMDAPLSVVVPEEIRFLDGCRGMEFSLKGEVFRILETGRHQAENAALAIAAVSAVEGITHEHIWRGLEAVRLPGRIEFRGRLIVDTGHNPLELRALFDTLRHCLPPGKRVVVCGFAERKNHSEMLAEVLRFADAVVLTKSEYRGIEPERLLEIARSLPGAENRMLITETSPVRALERGRLLSGMDAGGGFLVVTGSTFLIDDIFNPDPVLRALNSGLWKPDRTAKLSGYSEGKH